jgi:hypothetical protein
MNSADCTLEPPAVISEEELASNNQLEHLLKRDINLRHFKDQILASGLTLDDIEQSTLEELQQFLGSYIRLPALAAKKCAQTLKKAVSYEFIDLFKK